jgi:hypothetical protein
LLLALACLLSFPVLAREEASPAETPVQQVEAVVGAFRTAIIDKDKARFSSLFLHENITWQSVRGDETLQRVRLKQPEAVKVSVNPEKTFTSFIDGIVAAKEEQEKKFWNVRIDTDGNVASVVSDYSFHASGKETNRGKEAWHLVRTDEGWKIVSVIWSVNRSPEPKQ